MKKVYDKKGNVIAVALSIKEQEELARTNMDCIKKQKVEEAKKWLEELRSRTRETPSEVSSSKE